MNRTWWGLLAAIAGHVVASPFVTPEARSLAVSCSVAALVLRPRRRGVLALALILGSVGGLRLHLALPPSGTPPRGREHLALQLLERDPSGVTDAWFAGDGLRGRIRLSDVPDSLGAGSRLVGEVDFWRPVGPRNPDDREPRRSALAKGTMFRGRLRSVESLLESSPPSTRRRLRDWVRETGDQRMGLGAGLWSALLLGDRAALEASTQERFAKLGLAHLLALSGLHVGVVAALLLLPLRRWGRRDLPLVLPVLCAWAWAAGAGASLVRAVGMLAWWAGARSTGRPARALDAVATIALLECVLRPAQLTSLGWWLSYAATAAILRILPSLQGRSRWLGALALSAAAQTATAPWTLDAFGRWVWAGPVVQLVVGPPFAVLLSGGVVLVAVAAALPPLAPAAFTLLAIATHLFGALLALVERVAPAPMGHPGLGDWWPAGLAALSLWLPPWSGVWRRRLTLTALLVAVPHLTLLRGPTRSWVSLDVGQGDAGIYREGATTIVVDAGGRSPHRNEGERVVLPFLARRNESGAHLVLTHGHLDHTGGARALLRSGRFETLVLASADSSEDWARELAAFARASGTRTTWAASGDTLSFDAVRVPVLWPPATAEGLGTNDRSLVLQLGPSPQALLATGDLEREGERQVVEILRASPALFAVLKVAHHGGDTGTDGPLLTRVAPGWALLSCGRANRYGHPHPSVLDRLLDAGAACLRTDRRGALTVEWPDDARDPRVRAVRQGSRSGRPP